MQEAEEEEEEQVEAAEVEGGSEGPANIGCVQAQPHQTPARWVCSMHHYTITDGVHVAA